MSDFASVEAEQAVLGSMLIDSRCIREIAGRLRETDFSVGLNQALFSLICDMDRDGQPVDGITVCGAAVKAEIAEDKTLRSYLAQLMEITPTAANAAEYAALVAQTARRRVLKEGLEDALRGLAEHEAEDTVLSRLDAAMAASAQRTESELAAPKELADSFLAYRERIDEGAAPYVRTGVKALDKLLGGGMVEGGLYILAGRPGMGKTALGIAIAEHVAQTVGRVDYFSLEMSRAQIMARRLASIGKMDSKRILMDSLTPEEYKRMIDATRQAASTPLYATDGQAQSAQRITAIARAGRDVKLAVVDHFGLILRPGRRQDADESREIAHALKRLAQSLNQPVLCLAQLNRQNEQRSDKRPTLADLRATGAMEEDADGVIFIHRPDYYDADYKREPGAPERTEVILAKNRHGSTGKINLSFWPETNTFNPAYVE